MRRADSGEAARRFGRRLVVPLYKQELDGKFVAYQPEAFDSTGLEALLEDWIVSNPHLVLEGERIAIFARQPETDYGKRLDLLAIDERGDIVIIELKIRETPRQVVAQALEYAAWVDSLNFDQLDDIAEDYSASVGRDRRGLGDIYAELVSLPDEAPSADPEQALRRVSFNTRQRVVIVAERITDEVEQTLRYLRTKLGADVHGVEFGVHRLGGDLIISTNTVVGRERESSNSGRGPSVRYELPAVGTRLVKNYKGKDYAAKIVEREGKRQVELDQILYDSLSAAARSITNNQTSGPKFWTQIEPD
jgi:hypothetical protein